MTNLLYSLGACLKIHSRNLHAPIHGIFCPNSVAVARYAALIRSKSSANCDAHLAESIFQTHSRVYVSIANFRQIFSIREIPYQTVYDTIFYI